MRDAGLRKRGIEIGGVRTILVAVVITIAFVSGASAGSNKFPDHTPYQESIKKSIANGNITPSNVTYTLDVIEKDDKHIKLNATTTITFKNSKEAGLDKWKKIEVKDLTGVEGVKVNKPGDYDQKIKDYIQQQIQNIPDQTERAKKLEEWNNYDYETGERTITIVETYNATYPNQSQAASYYTKVLSDPTISNTSDVLMGFTLNSPTVEWSVNPEVIVFGFVVASADAEFKFDAALGLRLPTEVTLNHPDQLNGSNGSSYTLSTSIVGADWDAAKYSAVNVPPENGNEFVARLDFLLGLKVILVNINVLDWSLSTNKDYGKSFTTPFGPNQSFPIPPLNLSPSDTGLNFDFGVATLGIGLIITPDIGSKTISADWQASGDSIGRGSVVYNEPGISYDFGPVTAGEYDPNTDNATILLNNYKYFFDIFKIDVAANIALDVSGLGNIGTPFLDLFNIDISSLTGGLFLGIHPGTTANSAQASIPVEYNNTPLPVIYVGLGDSYSAGQGNPPYLGGTDVSHYVNGNMCHRSHQAYSQVLGTEWGSGWNRVFHACSGAVTDNINSTGQYDELPQLQNTDVNSTAGLVTMTIGGNDAGFASVLQTCILQSVIANTVDTGTGLSFMSAVLSWFGVNPPTPLGLDPSCVNNTGFEDSVNAQIDNVFYPVKRTYKNVSEKVNTTGSNTSVIVADYPHLFPDSSSGQDCSLLTIINPLQPLQPPITVKLSFLFTPADQQYLNTASDRLDGILKKAAGEAGVNFVDVRSNFTGHSICGNNGDWLNALVLYQSGASFISASGYVGYVGSFHPNANGHTYGYAAAIESYIRSATNLTPQGYPVNPPALPDPPTTTTNISTASVVVQALTVSPLTAGTAVCEDAYRAGQQLLVSGDGFASNASVQLYVTSQSGEQQVGNLTADSTGHVASTISIPLTAIGFLSSESQAGLVFISAIGLGPDGAHVGDIAMKQLVPPSSSCGVEQLHPLGSISGIKFNDLNGNGVRDIGEPGLANWTITLTNSSGGTITQTTDADGSYNFTNLTDDNYTIGEVIQPSWIQTAPAISVNGTATYTVNISGGNAVTGNDFGNFQLGSVSGMKFEDLDANGIRDPIESGLAGWNITINGTDTITGTIVNKTTTTNTNGNYNFTGLTAGTYVISETLKNGWIQTAGTYTVNITSGSNITRQDFGNFHKGNITGGGWINITGDPKATFGIVGQYPNASNTANGSVGYHDHIANLNVTSIQINTVATTLDKKKGVITGLAHVNGAGSYPFLVYVEDNAEPGKGADVFKIALPTYPYSNGGVLSGGNIQIHS